MKRSTFVLWLVILPLLSTFELIDYSNEPYALIPIEHAYLYRESGTLFHVFNISDIEQRLDEFWSKRYHTLGFEDRRLAMLMDKCREYLNQLTVHRNKRSLNFLGTSIKFVTGMPDHDDMVLVQNKLNDLIENNNRLAVINSHLQQKLEGLVGNPSSHLMEVLLEFLASELSQIIQTINLARVGILNTVILNMGEIGQIIKEERNFSAPLMEVLGHSTFKILEVDLVYVLLIRYPRIEQKCMLYDIRPLEKEIGKLKLERFATYCNGKYLTVRNCKKYVAINICRHYEHTCTQELLNGIKTKCTMVKERMPEMEEIDDGKILIHGNHKINNITRRNFFGFVQWFSFD